MASLPSWAQLTEPSALSCLYSAKRCLPSAITPALPVFLQEGDEQLVVDLQSCVNAAVESCVNAAQNVKPRRKQYELISLPGLGIFEVAGHVLKLVHDEDCVLAK